MLQGLLPSQQLIFGDYAALSPYTLQEFANRIKIVPYHFRRRAAWTISLASAVDHYVLPTAIEGGNIAIGLQTEASKGLFCASLPGATGTASTNVITDDHGRYANAIWLRRPLDGTAAGGLPLSFNDGTNDFLVFGLLHCASSVADGDAATDTNRQISFVYEDLNGVLQNTSVSGNIDFEMLFAVAEKDYPYELI